MAEKKTEKKTEKKAAKKTEKKAQAKRERKPSALRKDHVKVIQFLGRELPKRTAFSMGDIASAMFKDGPNITAERIARNSVRKPRQLGLVEIADRGQYRLTPAGAAFHKNLKSYELAPDIQREASTAKKGAAKKVVKSAAAKPAAKKAAPAKAAAKPAAKKADKPVAKKAVAKKAVAKKAEKVEKVAHDDPDFPDVPVDVTGKDAAISSEEPAADA